jgi:seryl-tRNA synthetase
MGIDVLDLIDKKGGNAEAVRESQRRRFASVELVDECIGQYEAWVKSGRLKTSETAQKHSID